MAAVVLAGGAATRLGGVDKARVEVHGRTLLQHTLAAVGEASPLVVVGPPRETDRPVRWTLESPAGGGPLAAIDAGLRAMPECRGPVAVVAVDHPCVTDETVCRLLTALRAEPGATGAVLDDGRMQWLLGVWQSETLRAVMPEQVSGRSVRAVLSELRPTRVPAKGAEASDVDTPGDARSFDAR
ncbi:NTP transferase domain-containing protein [Allosaccharopolyspora coralli]|uniref:NTP transferase domain-containing protein n=1 Tax=Allosaccharopolyspora coralli TaxID=2665642 RepID=A0A5Q3QE42_9PSEU|nr:NTP transferase domain-containing protein [Allosaccharopolyspora coralli]